ncbi:hypothetical protein MH117_22890 [Paenibacillus sp. ACRRX]|uniref:hypothetical protein n=1 Tax=Paenibacillus sp. ACRRX TaxID=2918206 RepID=UPI001EF4768C|nr:hypothetical protein [Paenibacillus sp. ACRRX]MCG7410264.1 hypothetical protein [Paenibacillus sp. ACRRX]
MHLNWYTAETLQKMNQTQIENSARRYWMYARIKPIKQPEMAYYQDNDSYLYGKAVHVLEEMMESENAELRLRAAEIVMSHGLKRSRGVRISS